MLLLIPLVEFLIGMSSMRSTAINRLREQTATAIFGPELGAVLPDTDQRLHSHRLKELLGYSNGQYCLDYPALYGNPEGSGFEAQTDPLLFRNEYLMKVRCSASRNRH
jgi:hypothetical protein